MERQDYSIKISIDRIDNREFKNFGRNLLYFCYYICVLLYFMILLFFIRIEGYERKKPNSSSHKYFHFLGRYRCHLKEKFNLDSKFDTFGNFLHFEGTLEHLRLQKICEVRKDGKGQDY